MADSPIRALIVSVLTPILVLMSGCASNPQALDTQSHQGRFDVNAGTQLLREGQLEAASVHYRAALNVDSDDVGALWGLALVAAGRHADTDAQRYFEHALRVSDAAAPIENSYAVFLCRRGSVDDALTYFRRAAADTSDPRIDTTLANAGLCLQRAGRPGTAARYFRRALETNPTQATALVHLAGLAFDRGHFMSARAFVERADDAMVNSTALMMLGARNELALGDADAARRYLERYNARQDGRAIMLEDLASPSNE